SIDGTVCPSIAHRFRNNRQRAGLLRASLRKNDVTDRRYWNIQTGCSMQNESIVIFSSDDWGWKTSKYQLSIRFAKHNKVLFVSSIGFRAPKASTADLGRIFNKLKSFLGGMRKV